MKTLHLWVVVLLFTSVSLYSETKVACIGNSITYGYGLNSSQAYPLKLQALLGSSYAVSNFGVSARTLLKKGDRPYWNESAYQNALALKPDVTIIMLGTNDSKAVNWKYESDFDKDYLALINSFEKANASTQVWICLLLPSNSVSWDILKTVIDEKVNPHILALAKNNGYGLIDLNAAFVGKDGVLLADGVHPNSAGTTILADYINSIVSHDLPEIFVSTDSLSTPEAFGYQWYFNGIAIAAADGGTERTIKSPVAGQYSVSVKISADAQDRIVSDEVVFETPSIVVTQNTVKSFAYLNTSSSNLVVKSDISMAEIASITICNLAGQVVCSKEVNSFTANDSGFSVSDVSLVNGIYYYKIIGQLQSENGSFVVN